MMNKKGFTLVELLAVLTIMGVVTLITVPIVTYSISNSKESLHKDQVKQILKGAIDWSTNNTDQLPINGDGDNKTIVVVLGFLKANGYVNNSIKDPRTGYLYLDETAVEISYDENHSNNISDYHVMYNGNYKFEVKEKVNDNIKLESGVETLSLNICGTSNSNLNDDDNHKYVLDNNQSGITACQNSNLTQIYEGYNDSLNQIYYYDRKGNPINRNELLSYHYNGTTVYSIDMTKYGFYYVTYNSENSSERKILMINDLEVPVPHFDELSYRKSYSINESTIHLLDNVSCTDNSKYCSIKTSGSITPGIPGKYVITYIFSDESGNTVKVKKVITIQ